MLADYTLANPDTLTKYKTAAEISQKVLAAVSGALHLMLFVNIGLPAKCKSALQRVERAGWTQGKKTSNIELIIIVRLLQDGVLRVPRSSRSARRVTRCSTRRSARSSRERRSPRVSPKIPSLFFPSPLNRDSKPDQNSNILLSRYRPPHHCLSQQPCDTIHPACRREGSRDHHLQGRARQDPARCPDRRLRYHRLRQHHRRPRR